jgi:hypothetical protein
VPIATALTVAQPFGIRAEPITPPEIAGLRPVDPTTTHSMEVAGISVVRFRLGRRERIGWGEGGDPTHDLRVRSWVPPALLVDASSITDLCGVVTEPCWAPDAASAPGDARGVSLVSDRGDWLVIATAAQAVTGEAPRQAWRLSWGVVSPAGVVFWLLIAAVFTVRRVPRERTPGLD